MSTAQTLLRLIAWVLVIVGALFSLLQAWLVSVPLFLLGGLALWSQSRNSSRRLQKVVHHEGPNDNDRTGSWLSGFNMSWWSSRNDATSSRYIPNESDPRNPHFRSFDERHENQDLADLR